MHLAVMGGTFNPIHNGHLGGAREVIALTSADKVLFVPAARPPHKEVGEGVPALVRLEMVRLAIEGEPDFELSDIELKRGGTSYTIDTLASILDEAGEAGEDMELSLIIGGDSFNEFSTWHRYADILRIANLVVMERPGSPVGRVEEVLVELRHEFCYDFESDTYKSPKYKSIIFPKITPTDISSTEIRRMVGEGADTGEFLPPAVAAFIEEDLVRARSLP